jgi:hypothetical protein
MADNYLNCKCEYCGNEFYRKPWDIRNRIFCNNACYGASNAGKPSGRAVDLTGERFGKLKVIEKSDTRRGKQRWKCLCDCGNFTEVASDQLRSGHTKSCNCIVGEYHGLMALTEYKTWAVMKARCFNKNNPKYKDYGGRGISISPEWLHSFTNFLADMGLKPSPKHSIERIDNNGNYEKNNCRWATGIEQQRNKRTNRLITFNGETLCVQEWAERLGMNRATLRDRLKRWSVEKSLTQAVGPNGPKTTQNS